jgi:hypothetical protein
MNPQQSIMKPTSKLLALGSLTIALVLGGASLASAGTRDNDADLHTDRIFYKVNPELNQRKLRSNEYGYIQEWQNIRKVVYDHVIYAPVSRACVSDEWYMPDEEGFRDRVVDSIFYSRNPELVGRKIGVNDRAQQQEWLSIQKQANSYLRLPLC